MRSRRRRPAIWLAKSAARQAQARAGNLQETSTPPRINTGSVAERSVRTRPLKAVHRFFMKPGAVGREAAKDDARQRWSRWQSFGQRFARGAGGEKGWG